MTTQTQATSVTTSTEVHAPIEHAFRVFTEATRSHCVARCERNRDPARAAVGQAC
jgi:hypothetical protein